LKQWLTDKCIPLVREVTFENVEELTEEGKNPDFNLNSTKFRASIPDFLPRPA
jgi:hypothetical protein